MSFFTVAIILVNQRHIHCLALAILQSGSKKGKITLTGTVGLKPAKIIVKAK